MFQEIKDKYNLNCTENDFHIYMKEYYDNNTIPITLEKYTFDDLYNGNQIECPFVDDRARYYVLQICGNTYLQVHIPYVDGIQMITDENFDEVSSEHAKQLAEEYLQNKAFQESINYFQSK